MSDICEETLITTKEETRKGFIEFALEKNRRSQPYIDEARAFRHLLSHVSTPRELLDKPVLQASLLTAAGISDKALSYFDEQAKREAIENLIENFLEPAGNDFIEEAVYRFILVKGDSLGGRMRNLIGKIAQSKLIRSLISIILIKGITCKWSTNTLQAWQNIPEDNFGLEDRACAFLWYKPSGNRILTFNKKIPAVDKNIDLCLFNCLNGDHLTPELIADINSPIMFGELKGGIDPAGADEHWKTANTALNRIRQAYINRPERILTSFIGAAIERNMAFEICNQLTNLQLDYAANLTKSQQIYSFCEWLLDL